MRAVAVSKAFGKKLAQLRAKAGITQSHLGEMIGVSRQAICQFEKGQSEPTWETVRKLARALGVSVADFDIGEEDESPKPKRPKK